MWRLSKKVMCRLQENNRSTSRWTRIERSDNKETSNSDSIFITNSELKSKGNIVHKLIDQNNCQENTNRTSINQSSPKLHPTPPRAKTL